MTGILFDRLAMTFVLMWIVAGMLGCGSTESDLEKQQDFNSEVEAKTANTTAVARRDEGRILSGERLAKQHCCACHLLPSPNDLPSDRWKFMVEWMGHYLGHPKFSGADKSLIMPQFVPSAQKVTKQELEDIEYYFVQTSDPEISPTEVIPKELAISEQFKPRPFISVPPRRLVSGLFVDEAQQRVYVANGSGGKLLEYDFAGKTIAIHDTKGTQAVEVQRYGTRVYATLIGDMYALKEFGAVMSIEKQEARRRFKYTYPVRNYFRLAHVSLGDLNGDGNTDLLSSGFGSSGQGAFSIFYGTENENEAPRYDLIKHCGTVSSEVIDIDNDGDLDILALTTQGFHDLWLFENVSAEKYIAKRIWKKSPSTGSTSMEAADFDGDGKIDLAITAGNNFEMSNPPIRPYHGVYVFKNLGELRFEEAFFYPLPGAARMVIDDLNEDGRPDIAAVSSLPDWRIKNPVSMLLLDNQGKCEFEAAEIRGLRGTQWMSIASGDIDKDGDQDLILGAMDITPEITGQRSSNFEKAIGRQPSVLFLENTSK